MEEINCCIKEKFPDLELDEYISVKIVSMKEMMKLESPKVEITFQ